uniref:Uncharacterized protein n=1 Tax=Utricularia reniformis TaxID=192314 RepID=A0A1Y0AZL0_9LAMI|nr:hypothetical protein AEK19_MT0293 [Utricularia reniformis]ART30569.1 hypothetical protein AEK19_MT0293 [Utricularia reniformis]
MNEKNKDNQICESKVQLGLVYTKQHEHAFFFIIY